MNFFMDDLGKLVKETFKLHTRHHGSDPFGDESVENQQIPEGPGLLYYVDKASRTFRVHSVACKSMKQTFQEIQDETFDFPSFLDPEKFEWRNLKSFSTQYFEIAEVISELVGFRRYPIEEQDFYNLGDPGHSWWLKVDGKSLTVFFKMSHCGEDASISKLGPIGDFSLAERRFSQSKEFFESFLALEGFECNENRLMLQFDPEDKYNAQMFARVLLEGNVEIYKQFQEHFSLQGTLDYFFRELISCRRFWIEVEREIYQN